MGFKGLVFLIALPVFAHMGSDSLTATRGSYLGRAKATTVTIDSTPPDTATKYFLTKGNGNDSNKVKRTVVAAGTGITITQSNDTLRVSEYQPPDIATYTNTAATNYAGQTVTGLTTNWTLTGSPITGQTHTDVSPDPDIADRSHVFTGLSLTTDKTYKLRITDGVTPDSAYTYVRFYISTFYGTSVNAAPTESDIEAGTATSETQSAVNRALSSTAITGGGNYVFYAYPASWGNVQLYVNGFATTWIKTTVSVTNAYGDTRNYYVYTSPTTIVGSIYLSAVAS